MFYERDAFKKFIKFIGKYLQWTSAQGFSSEFCRSFKNNYFVEHLQITFFGLTIGNKYRYKYKYKYNK